VSAADANPISGSRLEARPTVVNPSGLLRGPRPSGDVVSHPHLAPQPASASAHQSCDMDPDAGLSATLSSSPGSSVPESGSPSATGSASGSPAATISGSAAPGSAAQLLHL
jgi:hypothetical protein